MRVRQFEGKTGPVKNQFIIEDVGKIIFQSYDSIIAVKLN
jgi:CRISPR/Cas system-associated endoribonuclease Cas2